MLITLNKTYDIIENAKLNVAFKYRFLQSWKKKKGRG